MFTPFNGVPLDEASLTDADPEFTLSGAGADVVVSGAAQPVAGQPNVYRYALLTPFTQFGRVQVDFLDGAFLDDVGTPSVATSDSFFVQATLDESTILDSTPEFVLEGDAAADVVVSGSPTPLGDGVYRYTVTGTFGLGEVTVRWLANAVTDSAGLKTIVARDTFVLAAPGAEMAGISDQERVDRSALNDNGYIDIRFLDGTGRGQDGASITDAGQEFEFLVLEEDGETWVAPFGVSVNGVPLLQEDGSYRYFFAGTFEPGPVRVVFLADSFRDVDGAGNVEEEQLFAVVNNAPSFQITIEGSLEYRTGFKSGLFGNLSNPDQLRDLLRMMEPVMGELGEDLNGDGDTDDEGEEGLGALKDILEAVDTGLGIITPFITEPLVTMHGFLRMGSELLMDGSEIIGARTTLEGSGGVSVYMLGPVGAAAGKVVMQADNENGLSLWGVMELQAKFDALTKAGIDLQGFANLQFNTTAAEQIESLTLEGFGEGGSDLTQTYQIAPTSLQVAMAGKLLFHVPTLDEADPFGLELFRISGAASLTVSAYGLQMFSKGDLEIGPPEIRLLDIDALGVFVINDTGVAGDVQVEVKAGDIAAIRDYFQFDLMARIVFNTTGEDQEVKVLDRFLEFLTPEFIARLEDSEDAPPAGESDTFSNTATKCYVVGAAPPPRPVDDGTPAPPGPYIVIATEGNLMIAEAFRMHGDFYFEVNSTPEMFVTVNASMALDPLGAAAISGTFHIDQYGAYGGLQIGASLDLGPLSIFGAAQFEFNSQDFHAEVERYKFDFDQRRVTDEREVITVHVDASFDAFGANFLYVNGDAYIVKQGDTGFVCNLVASAQVPIAVDGVFEMEADFVLQINSRGGSGSDVYDLGLARSSFFVSFDGKLNLLSVLELEGHGFIEYKYGVFRMEVGMHTNFFGLAELTASGFFSSEGEFELYFGGSFAFGVPGFLGVQAGGSIHVSLLDSNGTAAFGDGNTVLSVDGGLNGTFWVFGFSVGASIAVDYSSAVGLVSITPHFYIDLLFYRIDISHTFNIGTLKANPPIYVAGNEDDTYGQAFRGGLLYLNAGDRAWLRNYDLDVQNEHFAIQYIGPDTENGGHIVRVAGNNVKRTFHGVTAIVADTGSGRDFIETDAALPIPVTLRGGSQRDRIIHRGSGPAIIDGGLGDDELTGGTGENVFVAGESFGSDVIASLGGTSTLEFNLVRSDLTGMMQTGAVRVSSQSLARTAAGAAAVLLPDDDDPLTGPQYIAVTMVHDGDSRLVIRHPGHPFHNGDRIEIASPDVGFDRLFTQQKVWGVSEVTPDSYVLTVTASQIGRGSPAKAVWVDASGHNVQRQVIVLHDGRQTATVFDPGHGVHVGDEVVLDSPDSANYTDSFVVTAVTGTLLTFGDATDLVLSADDDVIVRGNLDLRGAGSNLILQSDRSVFVEGFVTLADGDVTLYGGVELDGTDRGGADAAGNSVVVYNSSQVAALNAGNRIDIRGSRDVELRGAVTAGGVLADSGVNWTAPGDAVISVTAGQQVVIDSALQASRSVTVTGGVPDAGDNGLSVLITPTGGLNAAGLSGGTGGLEGVRITASGDLEMMGRIVSGATIVETADGPAYDWAGDNRRDSDVTITADGRAFIGGNTVNVDGDPITDGGTILASHSIQINGGSVGSATGVGVEIHPNSELSTHNDDGSIVLDSGQDADVRGTIASGGEINDGVVTLFEGEAAVLIVAAHQVRISREVAAAQSITVSGGTDPVDAGDSTSGQSVVVAGSGLLRTASANGSVTVSGPQSMTFFSPVDLTAYNVQSPGLDSVIDITSGGHLTMAGRLQSYRDIQLNGLDPTTGAATEGTSVELTETSLLETINGSITFAVASSGVVNGNLTAGGEGSDITLQFATDNLTIGGDLKAADEIVLVVPGVLDVQGSLLAGNRISLTASTDIVGDQTDLIVRNTSTLATTAEAASVVLVAQNNILIDGSVGSHAHQDAGDPSQMPYAGTDLSTVSIESLSGDVTITRAAGRVESGAWPATPRTVRDTSARTIWIRALNASLSLTSMAAAAFSPSATVLVERWRRLPSGRAALIPKRAWMLTASLSWRRSASCRTPCRWPTPN